MSIEPGSLHSNDQPQQRLEQLEDQWLRGEIPDIASYLRSSKSPDVLFWHNLIELDLEYRWKRFRAASSKTGADPHRFPLFPRLEDYAGLLEVSQRQLILTPELLAEEYRVRRSWGDRPARSDYLARLPLDSTAVESALNQIETEFEIERATPVEEEESSQLVDASTWLVHKQKLTADIAVDAAKPPRAVGKYVLEVLLGRGGFGEVWKAYDPDLKRSVALKFPRRDRKFTSETIKFFRSEAQKTATLERVPGIVPVYEAGESDGRVYIVSYLVQGKDLAEISRSGELSYAESARIVAEVAETLHRAHLRNLFHRDVKLSNILVGDDGDIFLSDFGLCISEEEQLKEGHSTTGTYAYMAPEQIRGFSHRLDGRADIYAIGVVLYRMFTGRFPYLADTPQEYLEQVIHREPRPPRSIKDDIPAELERICLKCLNKDISKRYTTAGDLARELKEWDTVRQEHSKNKKQKQLQLLWLIASAAVLVVITIGASSYFFKPENPPLANTDAATNSNSLLVAALAFPDGGADSVWQPLNEGRSLQVHSQGLSMLKLGETNEQLSLEADISQLKWTGQIGFFYGYTENIVNGIHQASYYVIEIVSLGESDYYLVHSRKRHSVQNPFEIQPELLESRRIGAIKSNTVNLRLRLSPNAKCETFYDGHQVVWDQTMTEGQFNEIDVSGGYGVFNYVSSGTYHNLKIDDDERIFAKQIE